MNTHYEKILYLYSRALEDADFEAISEIMMQAAHDATLKGLLFELETAYQTELHELATPKLVEVPMFELSNRSNGYHPAPALLARHHATRPRSIWVFRVAVLLVVLVGTALFVRASLMRSSNEITTTLIAPENSAFFSQNPTPVPLDGHPIITPQNADQLVEIEHYGTGVVRGMIWSPDSRTLLYYGMGLWFYDAETLSQTRFLDTGTLIYDVAYSPDGTRIATGNQDGALRIYDATSGAEQLVIPTHAGRIAFSPDGKLIASGGGQDDPVVSVWDAFTGRERLAFRDFITYVAEVAFSPDGTLLAAAGDATIYSSTAWPTSQDKNAVLVWDISSGEQRITLLGPEQPIRALAFHPGGRQLIAGSQDGTIYQWNLTASTTSSGDHQQGPTKEYIDPNYYQPGSITYNNTIPSLAYSPDGTWIASLHSDSNLRLWQGDEVYPVAFREPNNEPLTGTATGLAYRPDGQQLAILDYGERSLVWDMAEPMSPKLVRTIQDHNPELSSVDISATGTWIAAGSWSGSARVWNTATGELVNQLPGSLSSYVLDMAFDPTGTYIAVGQIPDRIAPTSVTVAPKYALLLWSPDPGVPPVPLGDPGGSGVNNVAFNGDGTRLFATHNQGVQVWDVASRQVLNELTGDDEASFVIQLTPSPAGDILAFTNYDRSVHLWNSVTGEELPPLTGFSESVYALAFSLDGSQLATLDVGGNLTVWDTATWTEAWYAPHVGGYWAVAFSPDGALLAIVGNEGGTLWDVESHQQVISFAGNMDGTYDVVFSQDGTLLVTAGGDGLARVWAVP